MHRDGRLQSGPLAVRPREVGLSDAVGVEEGEVAISEPTLDVSALEQWLWDAACVIRGPLDAPKFKDYILPLVFLKRLSDVFEDEVARLAEYLGKDAPRLVDADH